VRVLSLILVLCAMLWSSTAFLVPRRLREASTRRLIRNLSNDNEAIKDTVHRWVDQWVVAQGLCPWASSVKRENKLKVIVQTVPSRSGLTLLLQEEWQDMMSSGTPTESTLIVVPQLTNFDDFLDYVDVAEGLLRKKRRNNDIQIATFHPKYQFQGNNPSDVSNYTNRSPYPILHLLKVQQVAEAIARVNGNTEFVWNNNIRRMNSLGLANVQALQDAIANPSTSAQCPVRPQDQGNTLV
jgi:hypothetical protein